MSCVQVVYLLRWRLDFAGRGSVYGMWSDPGITAWDKNREGLVRASIEAKHIQSRITRTVVECDGHDFRNFQWIAVSRVGAFRGSVSPATENVGLKLLTTDEEVSILVDGQGARLALTDAEKGIQFATYGR